MPTVDCRFRLLLSLLILFLFASRFLCLFRLFLLVLLLLITRGSSGGSFLSLFFCFPPITTGFFGFFSGLGACRCICLHCSFRASVSSRSFSTIELACARCTLVQFCSKIQLRIALWLGVGARNLSHCPRILNLELCLNFYHGNPFRFLNPSISSSPKP